MIFTMMYSEMFSSLKNVGFFIYLVRFCPLTFLVAVEKSNEQDIWNCLSKCDNKPFTIHAPSITSRHDKK